MKNNLSALDPRLISIRDLTEEDIPFILNYWFHSPPGFIEAMGVDTAKLPSEADMAKSLEEKCRINRTLPASKTNALVVSYANQPIGLHTLFPFTQGDSGIFHAHLWKSEMRGRGLALHSYPRACQIFIQRFDLKRILFKTPIQNKGAIRVKEKLGIRSIGEETIGFGIIRDGTRAKVFELSKEESFFLCDRLNADGVDHSQIQRNLALTPEERILEHQNSLDLAFKLRNAGVDPNEEPQ